MSLPPLIPENSPTMEGWQRKVRDLVNQMVRRLMGIGPTADRPANPTDGQSYYDTDAGMPAWWNAALGLWLGASGSATVKTKTANFTMANTESVFINNKTGSSLTVTLPSANDFPNGIIICKTLQAQTTVSASSNVKPIASATPGTAILPATVGAWAVLISDGQYWVVMARGT